MKESENFDYETFKADLTKLEKELLEATKKDPEYAGEIDEVLEAIKRLNKEFKDPKYKQVLPDILNVMYFLGMLEGEEGEEDEDEEYFEDEDENEDT